MSLKCKACDKSIYPNDPQISLDGTVYHKPCAKCADCSCQISLNNFTKSGDTLLCKTHYFKRFHEEGSYLGGDKYSRMSSRDSVAKSPAAEPITASAGSESTPALSAASASVTVRAVDDVKSVESTQSLRQRFEKQPVSTAEGEGKASAKRIPSFGAVNPKCAVCSKSIYPNDPQIALDGVKYHSSCAKCADCSCQITISNFTKSGTTLLCKTHYFTRFSVSGSYLGGEKFEKKADRDRTIDSSSPGPQLFDAEADSGAPKDAADLDYPTPPDTTVTPPAAMHEIKNEPVVLCQDPPATEKSPEQPERAEVAVDVTSAEEEITSSSVPELADEASPAEQCEEATV